MNSGKKSRKMNTPPFSGIKKVEHEGEAVFLGSGMNFS